MSKSGSEGRGRQTTARERGTGGPPLTLRPVLNVMKEASLGGTLRRVIEGASSKEARLHVARWIGSQSSTVGLLPAR